MAKRFQEVYLLQLHGWGGADMLNLFDPSGRKLISVAEKRRPIAPRSQTSARTIGANKIIPFSSFHRYQREDSAWANDLIPDLEDYRSHAMETGRRYFRPLFGSTVKRMKLRRSIRRGHPTRSGNRKSLATAGRTS